MSRTTRPSSHERTYTRARAHTHKATTLSASLLGRSIRARCWTGEGWSAGETTARGSWASRVPSQSVWRRGTWEWRWSPRPCRRVWAPCVPPYPISNPHRLQCPHYEPSFGVPRRAWTLQRGQINQSERRICACVSAQVRACVRACLRAYLCKLDCAHREQRDGHRGRGGFHRCAAEQWGNLLLGG